MNEFSLHDEYISKTVAYSDVAMGVYMIVNTLVWSRYASVSHIKKLYNKLRHLN